MRENHEKEPGNTSIVKAITASVVKKSRERRFEFRLRYIVHTSLPKFPGEKSLDLVPRFLR